ncbi:acetylglutamate kinase [Thalassotalea maritima]|uniref:acetylglutamate kinase n=1 Tax=Thalassotalea maritima TaxID=3242416 RepID=UPI0035290721
MADSLCLSKPLVIKIGGAIAQSDQALTSLFCVVAKLQQHGQAVVIVHGGGCVADVMLQQAGFISHKVDGLRVSEQAHMPIIAGALAGTVNKQIVAIANNQQLSAVGLALHDGQTLSCIPAAEHLGCVGIPSPSEGALLNTLLATNVLPIFNSIGALADGQLVNVNADDAAVAITQLVDGELVLLTDVAGVKGADQQYLTSLDHHMAQQLISDGVITDGMVAKVNAAFVAANHLRRSIAVASWKTPEQLFALTTGDSIGTRIIPNS